VAALHAVGLGFAQSEPCRPARRAHPPGATWSVPIYDRASLCRRTSPSLTRHVYCKLLPRGHDSRTHVCCHPLPVLQTQVACLLSHRATLCRGRLPPPLPLRAGSP
jgi:hypothetical protein